MSSTMDMVNKPSIHEKSKSYTTNSYTANQSLINPVFNETVANVFSKLTISKENPIDISKSNIYANCDLKCDYHFSYANSSLVSKNLTNQLYFKLEQHHVPPVTYNNSKYNAISISLFSPSLHTFNGDNTRAEIVIEHTPTLGGKHLYVCLPIVKSYDIGSNASVLITNIINEVSKNAPGNNETTNLSITNFSLQEIVPFAPFYNYYGENGIFKGNFIVYDKTKSIPLKAKTLDLLSSLIKPSYNIMYGGNLYYNPLGPNSTSKNDIYISCQPTGSSNEKNKNQPKNNQKTTSTNNQFVDLFNSDSILNNFYFQAFIICIGFILFIMLLNFLYNLSIGKKKNFSFLNLNQNTNQNIT